MVRKCFNVVWRGLSRRRSRRRAVIGVVVLAGALIAPTWLGGAAVRQTHLAPPFVPLKVAQPHVVILKGRRVLYLFDGHQLVRTYVIDLGTNPVGPKARDDDGRTPEGRFRIVTRNPSSRYGRFLGISYPDEAAARRGVAEGYLSPGEADEIREALAAGCCPSWTTSLGGGLGLHGGGRGADWTAGCVALHDADVEELFAVLRVGDVVEILP